MGTDTSAAALVTAVAARHSEINRALLGLDQQQLRRQSRLPGWDRLIIACHLRYGATASRRMTVDALGGRPTAFYPLGREIQRASSLEPQCGESATDVVTSLDEESRRLGNLWQTVEPHQWQLPIDEPGDNPDLGSITLRTLALLRLTEVEAHGYDLDLDLSHWSTTFVAAALPMRLKWLSSRRSNHRSPDQSVDGSWALVSTDGPSFLIQTEGDIVTVHENAAEPPADTTIVATDRQLLAFILGRAPLHSLEIQGDQNLAASFSQFFPGP